MKHPKVVIIDYGVGNVHSLYQAVRLFSNRAVLSGDPQDITQADAIILPGDGAFKAGMDGLVSKKLLEPVREFIRSGKPVLGVCLGAQILLSRGFEFGVKKGLGVIPGTVEKFSHLRRGTKIPHIGWNIICVTKKKDFVLRGLGKNPYFYFVHSYKMSPLDPQAILATSQYGGTSFPAIVGAHNVYGCQFHPEKSAEAGLKLIKNFITLARTHRHV